MKGKKISNSGEKLKPLVYTGHSNDFIHFRQQGKTVSIPLRTGQGFLQGVGRTPRGEVLEFRYIPKNTIADGGRLKVQRINVVSEKGLRAEATPTLGHRFADPDLRGMRVGTKMYDIGERALAAAFPKRRGSIHTGAIKYDNAAFLASRGWFGTTQQDRERLAKVAGKRQPNAYMPSEIRVSKFVQGTGYHNPAKWHAIEVKLPDGTLKTMLIPVVQSAQEKRQVRSLLSGRRNAWTGLPVKHK